MIIYIYACFQVCNYIHISILHHIPHVVYTSIYIYIYLFTMITSYISYLHWSPIWFSSWQAPPGQRVRQVILRGCSDIPFAGWKTGALWVGQRGYCWLYTPKLWMLFTNHWSIAGGRSFSGTQGRSNNQTDRSWATDSHWWHGWPFPWRRMAFACTDHDISLTIFLRGKNSPQPLVVGSLVSKIWICQALDDPNWPSSKKIHVCLSSAEAAWHWTPATWTMM